jgi:purine catabolism regulator
MALTLQDILQFEIFHRADAEVVAGAGGLDRRVRWVHLSDVLEISHLLHGGELLLTTGMGLKDDPDVLRRYIRELDDVGIAGVVIGLRRPFQRLPDCLIEEAERRAVPLILVHREIPYVEVTETVHSTIINQQYQLLDKAEKVSRAFAQLALRGASIGQIIDRVAQTLQNPVILEDRAHQVVECASYRGSIDDLLGAWEMHSRSGHDWSTSEAVNLLDSKPRCAWMPIVVRDEVWFRLHVLEQDTELDDMDRLLIDKAGWIIGFTLLAERDARQVGHHARGVLLRDILNGRYHSSQEILRRARALGADLSDKQLAALVVGARDGLAARVRQGSPEQDRAQVLRGIQEEVRRAIGLARCAGLTTLDGDRVIAIVGVPASEPLRDKLDEITQEAGRRILESHDCLKIAAGASSEVHIESLRRGFDEAGEALRAARSATPGTGVTHFQDLGLERLLLRLRDGSDLAQYVESELGPLLAHDASHGVPLIPTLRAYFEAGGNKSVAAKALHIERKSLYYRLDRIRSLLRHDLDAPEMSARIFLALRGLELLQHNGRTGTE